MISFLRLAKAFGTHVICLSGAEELVVKSVEEIRSFQDLIRICGSNAKKISNAASVLDRVIFSIMVSSAVGNEQIGPVALQMMKMTHSGIESVMDIFDRRASGVFDDDDVFREIVEADAGRVLLMAAAAALGFKCNEIAKVVVFPKKSESSSS